MPSLRNFFPALLVCLVVPAYGQVSVPWSSMGGPLAGAVQCLTQANDGSLFIGTDASGVYRSTDGLNWDRASSGLGQQDVRSLAVEPDGHLLACTFTSSYPVSSHPPVEDSPSGGLYRSTDLGASWTNVASIRVSKLLVDTKGYIWRSQFSSGVGTSYLCSTNGGTTWQTRIPSYVGHPEVKDLAMDSSGNLYLGMSDQSATYGTYKSTNNGTSWTTLVSGVALYGIAITKGGYMYGNASPHYLVRVKTDGSGYTVLDSNWTAKGFAFLNNGYIYAAESDGSIIRSGTSGASWTTNGSASLGANTVYCPDGVTLFATATSGRLLRALFSSTSWRDVSGDLHNTYVPSLLVTRDNRVYAGTQAGIWRATGEFGPWNQRTSWAPFGLYPPFYVWALAEGSGSFLAAVKQAEGYSGGGVNYTEFSGSVFSTTDDWTTIDAARTGYECPYPSPPPTQRMILPYTLVVGSGDTVYLGGTSGFAKFVEGAYTALSGPLNGKTVYALAKNADDTLFAGTLNFGVFRSGTRGTTWAVASGGLANLDVYALATDADGRVFAGTGTGLYISKNNGSTWSPAPEFPSVRVQAIATNAAGHVYVATTDYVWMSGSHGTAPWYRLNSGLPIADISSIAIGPGNDVFAGTWGLGVYHRPAWPNAPSIPVLAYPADLAASIPQNPIMRWRKVTGAELYQLQVSISSAFTSTVFNDSTLTDTSRAVTLTGAGTYYWRVRAKNVAGASAYAAPWKFAAILTNVVEDPNIPAEFFLAQNHPNPFNPSTQIRYGLPVRSMVRIAVYNTLGQQVAVLKSEELAAGYHEVTFDARTMASGVYLCRMEAGSFMQVRKLVLVR